MLTESAYWKSKEITFIIRSGFIFNRDKFNIYFWEAEEYADSNAMHNATSKSSTYRRRKTRRYPIFIDVKEMDEETGETVRTEIYESVWKKL